MIAVIVTEQESGLTTEGRGFSKRLNHPFIRDSLPQRSLKARVNLGLGRSFSTIRSLHAAN